MGYTVTFHTVLKEPSYLQKVIIQKIAAKSARVVVMSHKAVAFLDEIYEIPTDKIHLIEHGVPDFSPQELSPAKNLLSPYKNRRVLFTFGLLNRNKGIETVIRALPEITKHHPEVVYLVLGKTHPGVLRTSGEEYRQYLIQLVAKLGMQKHVYLLDYFVTENDLSWYLSHIDIYITPYVNEAQITSGTLAYALGAGAAVLSTPYWHAKELLAPAGEETKGLLFDFKNNLQLAKQVNGLLDNPEKMDTLQDRAAAYGKKIKWPRMGKKYVETIHQYLQESMLSSVENQALSSVSHKPAFFSVVSDLPPFNMAHVSRLTDDTGIIQHAKYGIPNLKEGYCLDDNARAMILTLMAYQQHKNQEALRLLPVYLSFVHYMQREDGYFRNFLSFRREYLDEKGSEDAFGRTIWALGYLIRYAPNSADKEFGLALFRRAIPHFTKLIHLRGIADTIIGIAHYLACFPTDEDMMHDLTVLSGKMIHTYRLHASSTWQWFEEKMVYDNGILPLALLHSYEITGDGQVHQVAMESLHFLEKTCFQKEWFAPVGNNGWYSREKTVPLFDQQALETMAMVLLYAQANKVSGKSGWLQKMNRCHAWFLGENELHIPLYDPETDGCCDGLQKRGLNRNQGAESTLAYWISHLTVTKDLGTESRNTYRQPTSQKEVMA